MILKEYGTKPQWNKYEGDSQKSFDKETVANGYTNSFVLNRSQLESLALKSSFSTELQLKIFGNPSSVIQSILIFPFNIDVTAAKRGVMYLGGYDTEITCYEYTTHRYIKLNMGRIHIDGEDFSDYSGYCSAQIFFPYLGFVDYNINDIIDRDVAFWLYLDIKTGNGTYTVETKETYNDGSEYWRVISTHMTKIAVEIPAGHSGAGERALEATLKAINIGASVATSFLFPPPMTTTILKETKIYKRRNPETGRLRKISQSTREKESTSQREIDKGAIVSDTFTNSVSSIATSQVHTTSDRVNSISDLNFLTNIVQVVIKKPKILPTHGDYNHLFGKPLGQTRRLRDLEGFTVITNVHLDGLYGATSTELDIIDSVLKDGIII